MSWFFPEIVSKINDATLKNSLQVLDKLLKCENYGIMSLYY
ncbi:hypothetical protein PRUB_a0404 [Pseudoalteromonas rubra]|uniref:Uncharacterized protein n=1 Tax=Pseudoalteromonas rubra TaxID=43658 RepID=A0A8T0C6F8_9GAMM|nr:hypothetical protein PRUB_a0404 [Pseudoalteromonas rubra]